MIFLIFGQLLVLALHDLSCDKSVKKNLLSQELRIYK